MTKIIDTSKKMKIKIQVNACLANLQQDRVKISILYKINQNHTFDISFCPTGLQ